MTKHTRKPAQIKPPRQIRKDGQLLDVDGRLIITNKAERLRRRAARKAAKRSRMENR